MINARVAMRPRKLYHQRIIVITQRARGRNDAQCRCGGGGGAAGGCRGEEGKGQAKNLAIREARIVLLLLSRGW